MISRSQKLLEDIRQKSLFATIISEGEAEFLLTALATAHTRGGFVSYVLNASFNLEQEMLNKMYDTFWDLPGSVRRSFRENFNAWESFLSNFELEVR